MKWSLTCFLGITIGLIDVFGVVDVIIAYLTSVMICLILYLMVRAVNRFAEYVLGFKIDDQLK